MPIDPRTRGSLPPDPATRYPSVTSADMNNVYVALVDLSRRISELEGQRTVINDQSITTGMVQTGAITASTIAAGSIHAAQIEVGNVVASIMTVGAVNAGHIDAASIRASVLDASVLTATNAYITSLRASILDAGVLTAASAQIGTLRTSILNSTQIITQGLQTQVLSAVNAAITSLASFNVTSGTITADLIRTAASGARVEVGNSAGGIKGYNASNVMTFGFDTTTGTATVGAIAVTGANGTQVPASTLTGFLGGGNLLKDSSFESTDPALPAGLWSGGGTGGVASKQTAQAFHGTTSLRVLYGAPSGYVYSNVRTQHGVPMVALANRPVVYSAWVYITGTDNTVPTTDISLSMSDQTSTFSSTTISQVPKNAWTRVVLKATVPSSATDCYIHLRNPWSSGLNTVYYDGIQLELGDAATAYNPKADEIIYGSITAVELAANSVTASAINAGAIDGKVITGALFRSSATDPKVAFDSTGFYTTDASGNKLVTITGAGGINTEAATSIVNERSITWTVSGVQTGRLTNYYGGVGNGSYTNLGAQMQTGATVSQVITEVRNSSGGQIMYSLVRRDTTSDAASYVSVAATNAAGTVQQLRTVVDGGGQSSFLQLDTLGAIKMTPRYSATFTALAAGTSTSVDVTTAATNGKSNLMFFGGITGTSGTYDFVTLSFQANTPSAGTTRVWAHNFGAGAATFNVVFRAMYE